MSVLSPFKDWIDDDTGLTFSCPEDWQVSALDESIIMMCLKPPYAMMAPMIKVFRITGFERSDDPRLSLDFAVYMSKRLLPDGARLHVASPAERADAFGRQGVQNHWMSGNLKLTAFLVAHNDFLVALWASWVPSASHDEATESVLRQVFSSFSGKLKRAHKLYHHGDQELQIFTRADLDSRLIGSWQYESYTSIPSPGHSSGFSYSTSVWMSLWADGRFQRGSSAAVSSSHYDSCGDMTGTTHGLTEGQGEEGAWHVDGHVLRLNFDDGTYAEYRYEVWPDSMLLTPANGKESYWKRSS